MSVLLGDISVKIRKNSLARRVSVKIRHGNVELVIPPRASMRRAIKFLYSKEGWIQKTLSGQPKKIQLEIGARIPVLGTLHEIIYAGIRGKSEIIDGKIIIRGDEKLANKKIKKFLSEFLKSEIEKIADRKCKIINKKHGKISLRSTISRWGSCSSKGNLSFCWRIVFAPYEVLEYLVSHEVAHLAEMNHSKKFWDVVEKINPNHKTVETWLRKNGNLLHLYI